MPDLTIKQRLYRYYWRFIERYLQKRQPAAAHVTLVQKLIFILPTRYGWWFLFLICLLYLLGTNYQNNLILLLSYLLLSLFLLSIVLSYQNLSGLTLHCPTAAESFAGGKVQPAISLNSDKPHYMLQLNLLPQREEVLLAELPAAVTLSLNVSKRGRYVLPRIRVSSQYPLGLWRAWSYVALQQHFWVYPAADGDSAALQHATEDKSEPAKNESGDNLAAYRSGESVRHLIWKRLARDPTNPVVRQQQNSMYSEPDWVVVPALSGEALEHALRRACLQLLKLEQSGSRYGLKLPALTVPQAQGPLHLQRCLQELALC
ncbi:DUF58 domain-containing protein [Rheinheimera maricola]|uniref:DUF58 domain-containing protein n=1 Tax=Rheinheimera maricola TaxID=2793282 RepID=A0ABS7X877_9GAMM|nr:DUF58 domain-containing protein [Rheinheimera maricola]MBZ9611007.1 hypothetical protein [Rheinheimera maricola]